MARTLIAIGVVFAVCISRACFGATWYVDGTVAGSGDGTSWAEAFKTIQEGIDAATADGDTVIVAEGRYAENIRFGSWDIILRSTTPNDPVVVENTIIDGDASGPVVTLTSAQGPETVLAGFTITNGSADYGGGIYAQGNPRSDARIEHNRILRNSANFDGGAIYYCAGRIQHNSVALNDASRNGGGLNRCHGTIWDNSIDLNSAGESGGGLCDCDGIVRENAIRLNVAGLRGGGLYGCDGTIRDNSISMNSAEYGAGVALCNGTIDNNRIIWNEADPGTGGGLWACDVMIVGNTISNNSASRAGGGLSACDGIIAGNFIHSNTSESSGGALSGCRSGRIQSNLICANSCHTDGGAIFLCHGPILNNTIVANSAFRGGGLAHCDGVIRNCIIWENAATESPQLLGSADPSHSCIQDWTGGGEWNITANPLFVDRDGPDNAPETCSDNNYRLSSTPLRSSPCIDSGDNSVLDTPGLDMDGHLRIVCGRPLCVLPVVDMGAYEYISAPFEVTHITENDAGCIRLTWHSQPNDTYIILSSDSLLRGSWVEEARVTGTGPGTTWTDCGPFDTIRLYRVEMVFE